MATSGGGTSNSAPKLAANWRETIASLIKEHRTKQGWTQEELGHLSGYDPVYINMLERGRRNPSIRALVDLCQAFGVRPSKFLHEVEERLNLHRGKATH